MQSSTVLTFSFLFSNFSFVSAWCDVAQMVLCRLAARQALVRFSARYPREAFHTKLTSDEEMERNLGEWRRMNLLYESDGLNACTRNYHIKKKWHYATKPLKIPLILRLIRPLPI
jgi:hypothetical protein